MKGKDKVNRAVELSKMFLINIAEASVLGLIVTVGAVGFLTLCGVCTINWSMFIW